MKTPFTLTQSAIKRLNHLRKNLHLEADNFIRIGVKGGKGCFGVQHLIAFDYKKEDDLIYKEGNLTFIVDKSQTMHVVGMQIDYYEDETSKGFVFESPIAD